MRAADKSNSSSSTWLYFGFVDSCGSSSVDFRLVDDLTCSRIGSVGKGLIDDRAMDVLRGLGASGFGFFGALWLGSAGRGSS